MIFTNEIAASLRRAISDRSYDVAEGEIGTAWMDYGKIAMLINIRSRVEIRCKTKEQYCTIDNNIIAFVPYDEHHECGYLSDEKKPSDLLY